MTIIETLENNVDTLLKQETPALVELRKALLEIEDFISSSEYQDVQPEDQKRVQVFRKELKNKIRKLEEHTPSTTSISPASPGILHSEQETSRRHKNVKMFD